MIKTIINRDGTKAEFKLQRIETAIEKALHSCTGKDEQLSSELTSGISIQSLSKNLANNVKKDLVDYVPSRVITVELVQNIVEKILMKRGYYVVAKEYILYRDRHARIRKQFLCTESAGSMTTMNVIKRNGNIQPMSRNKILKRIRIQCEEHDPVLKCDPVVVAEKVAEGVYNEVTTRELDKLTITIAKNMVIQHPDYEKLAARIAISGHQKDTDYRKYRTIPGIDTQIAFVAWSLFHNTDQNGDHSPLLQKELYEYIIENQLLIDKHIEYERDFNLNIFGFQTLTRAYLIKSLTPEFPNRNIVERPQDMFMRVALGIHCVRPNSFLNPSDVPSDYEKKAGEIIDDYKIANTLLEKRREFLPDLKSAFETYSYMSMGYFIHATPTLFYAGTTRPGLTSCFLLSMDSDSIKGIYKTLSDCALISKNAGGIGVHIHNIRANQSYIRGTAGQSNGIVPMLKVYNDTAKYVDQCFAPGTLVWTKYGTKNIEEIKVDDELLTSNGNYKPVERVLEHDYEGDILVISHSGISRKVKVTPEHQILAITNIGDINTLWNKLDRGYIKAHMVDAKDLLLGDLIISPETCNPTNIEDSFVYESMVYNPITSISKEKYSGKVYDFEVAEEHTYVTELGSCHNGGGKRKGAFAVYLSCYHADILEFLELKLPHGQEHMRSRDLFYAFWRNDYFMECVIEDRDWYLMCPDECPGLAKVYGKDFVELYENYVFEGKYRKIVKARDVYRAVLKSRVECGVPYIGEKDSINRKSNQSNLGVIQSSNLCVSGDTYILTKEYGQIPISTAANKELNIWNGEEWSLTTIKQTGREKDLLRITFSNGVVLNCTPEHRFYLKNQSLHESTEKLKNKYYMSEAKSLNPGDILIDYKLPKPGESITNSYLNSQINLSLKYNNLKEAFKLMRLQLQTQGKYSFYSEKGLNVYNEEESRDIKVIKVEKGMSGVDTYCFTEEKRHMGMFNGILTGQCTEITLYSDSKEHACCNLNSIALPKFVDYDDEGNVYFDYYHLHKVAQISARNINKVIDRNYYPTPESERSNYRHRPIGIGVQGLWDVFMMFRVPFGSPKAIELDKNIFETIYHGALTASWELAREEGAYSSFWYNRGCPLSKGNFQFDLWSNKIEHCGLWDWEDLRRKIMRDGVRNSELIAPMPTASTSQILGWTECFEPIKSNIYKRKTSSGEFIVLNKYLYKDIEKLGLDVNYIREQIEANGGSVQNIKELPSEMKELYKTAWDIDQTLIVDHCAARGPYVTQSCSMNFYFDVVEPETLMKIDIYSWMKGIKTQYYTHSKSLTKAKQHHNSNKSSIDDLSKNITKDLAKEISIEGPVCRMEEGCLMCGS